MSIAQILFDTIQLLSNKKLPLRKRILRRAAKKGKTLYLRYIGDPLIAYNLDGQSIYIHLSSILPMYRWSFPLYSTNIGRIASYCILKYPDLTVIDIGANIGDSVAILRKHIANPVLCIEGDDIYFAILQKNAVFLGAVVIDKCYVGKDLKTVKANIQRQGATANFVMDGQPGRQSIKVESLEYILKRHYDFAKSKLIKIDTDGYDLSIIQGAMDWLEKIRPVLFFEYDPSFISRTATDPMPVLLGLERIGYQNMNVYTNTGEFLISVNLQDAESLRDIHAYFSGRKGRVYADMCLFHKDDNDIWQKARIAERDICLLSRDQ